MDLRERARLALMALLTAHIGLSPGLLAFDAPPKDQGHSGTVAESNPSDEPIDFPGQCRIADPVNPADGSLSLAARDLLLDGGGMALTLNRNYQSRQSFREGPFGFGWTHDFDVSLVEVEATGEVILNTGDGTQLSFPTQAGGDFGSPPGRALSLTRVAGGFEVRDGFGKTHTFESGRLTQVADRNGNDLTLAYDRSGKLTSISDPAGRSLRITYNATNKIAAVRDPAGRTYTYAYDGSGNLVRATNPLGDATLYTYDNAHRLTAQTDEKGVEIATHTYDEDSRVTRQFYGGGTFRFFYNSDNTQVCDRRNWCTRFYFNDNGNPTRTLRPVVGESQRQWSDLAYITTFTDEDGNQTTYAYDTAGNNTSITNPNNQTTSFTYAGSYNQTATITDALGRTETFTYDASGNLDHVQDALGRTIIRVLERDSYANATLTEDRNGVRTALSYDAEGRLVRTAKDGASISIGYDAAGNVTRIEMPDGAFRTHSYDAAGRLISTSDALGNRDRITRDAAGNVTSVVALDRQNNAIYRENTTYDDYNRPIAIVAADGRMTTRTYDAEDNLTRVTDPLNRAVSLSYDGINRLVRITNPAGGRTDFRYDDLSRITRVTRANGTTIGYEWDAVGNLSSVTSTDTGTTQSTYDATNRRIASTDARGVTATATRDALGRVAQVSYPTAAQNITREYDDTANGNFGMGRLTAFTDESGRTAFRYDAKGNLTRVTRTAGGNTFTTRYLYTATGQLAEVTYPTGRRVSYAYNAAGNVVTVRTTSGTTTTNVVSSIQYLPFGPPSAWTYGNGLNLNQTFDRDYRLVRKNLVGQIDLRYTFTAADEIAAIREAQRPEANQSFTYDANGQLETAAGAYGTIDFTYDAAGNRLQRAIDGSATAYTYTQDSNRVSTIGGDAVLYEANGNVTSHAGRTLTYNDRGQVASISDGASQSSFTYDARGQRASKTVGSATTLYHYDESGLLIAETLADGTAQREYIYLGRDLVAFTEDDVLYYVHTNHLAAPILATDTSGGIVWRGDYQPFGSISETATAVDLPVRAPGQYHDRETGLYYNRHRYYDPDSGRFLQADPTGAIGGLNPYAYVLNNPLSYIDPDGLEIRIYSAPAFFPSKRIGSSDYYIRSPWNHVWVMSTETGQVKGTNQRAFGGPAGGNGETWRDDAFTEYEVVDLPAGMSEREFMDRILAAENWNRGVYFPFVYNDCHIQLEGAFDTIPEVDFPGIPNGYFDVDDNIIEGVSDLFRSGKDSFSRFWDGIRQSVQDRWMRVDESLGTSLNSVSR